MILLNNKNKKQKYIFTIVLITVIVCLVFWPVFVWRKEIIFDEVIFINEWLKLLGSGFLIAFIFYLFIKTYTYIIEKINDENIKDECIKILHSIEKIINERDVSSVRNGVVELDWLLRLLSLIKKEKGDYLLIHIKNNCDFIKEKLNDLHKKEVKQEITISKISEIINILKK